MEVRPGYKQTEVGVIPEEWRLEKLIELIDPVRGVRYGIVQPGKYDAYGRYMIRGQDYSDGWVDPSEVFRVSSKVEEAFKNARIKAGDLLITIVGASTGRIAVTPDWLDGANLTQTTARLAVSAHAADSRYCFYILGSWYGSRQVANYIKGGAQPGLNCGDIEKFLIPLPPTKAEQRAIAGALGDVDALIGALEKLVAKKRALKRAAMQQLLTGQTRLPGFKGEWEIRRLGEVLSVRHGKSQHSVVVEGGRYPILATGGEIGRTNDFLHDRPSVLIGRKGTIDFPQYVDTPFWTIDTLFYTEVGPNADAKFLFYQFNLIPWRTYNEASGVPSLNASTIEGIELACPSRAEQTAIALVLSDMDAEIGALEARLAKTLALKQGMMGELLTGRTRLV